MFDGHGGAEVAKYTKNHFERLLHEQEEYKQNNYKEGLRKGFLRVDETLNEGGLEEVAKIKRDNPPRKSPLMKILGDVTAGKRAAGATPGDSTTASEEDDEDDEL